MDVDGTPGSSGRTCRWRTPEDPRFLTDSALESLHQKQLQSSQVHASIPIGEPENGLTSFDLLDYDLEFLHQGASPHGLERESLPAAGPRLEEVVADDLTPILGKDNDGP